MGWRFLVDNFCNITGYAALFPTLKQYDQTHISEGDFGGSIIHLIGRDQTPARQNNKEVREW